MVVTRVLTPRSAARALNWNILAIIAASIGLGTIVVKSGLGEIISSWIVDVSRGEAVLVAVVFAVVTTLVTNVVTTRRRGGHPDPRRDRGRQRRRAQSGGPADPDRHLHPLTFLNPIAHQTNLMVMGPGGYSTKTFVRFGIPVTIVALAVGIFMGWLLMH